MSNYLFSLIPEFKGEGGTLTDVKARFEFIFAHDFWSNVFSSENKLERIVVGHNLNNYEYLYAEIFLFSII